MTEALVIQVDDLRKHYGPVRAVDGISFAVARGATCALLGGNGAGKTTTIAMLLGLLLPTGGQIRILGEDVPRHRHRVLPRMNFSSPYMDLPQRLTVAENLTVYARLYGVRRIRERLATPGPGFGYRRLLPAPLRQSVRRPENPRGAGQGAAERAGNPAAGRTDRFARSRHRRPDARHSDRLSERTVARHCCSPPTT